MIEEIALELIKAIFQFLATVLAAHFYIDYRKGKKHNSNSLEIVMMIHHQINDIISSMLHETGADRVLLFQAKNGNYFLGGTPIMKLVPTNERISPASGLFKFKDSVSEVSATQYEDSILLLRKEKVITLSDGNQYEKLVDSRVELFRRGCRSGVYFSISKRIFGVEKIVAILCLEYTSLNPTFTQDQIQGMCFDEILKIKQLVSQKNDIDLVI